MVVRSTPGVDPALPARLLGGHVSERAQHHARHRQRSLAALRARDPEVEDADVAQVAAHEEEVARLDVPMDDALEVSCAERLGDEPAEQEALFHRERPPLHALRERLAFEPLGDQVSLAGGRGPLIDVPHDPGVLEPGEDLGLTAEAGFLRHRVEHLDRDLRPRAVMREVHLPHPARSAEALDVIPVRDQITGHHSREYRRQRGVRPDRIRRGQTGAPCASLIGRGRAHANGDIAAGVGSGSLQSSCPGRTAGASIRASCLHSGGRPSSLRSVTRGGGPSTPAPSTTPAWPPPHCNAGWCH